MSQLTLRTLIFAAGFFAVILVQYLLSQKVKESKLESSPVSDPLLQPPATQEDRPREAFEASEASSPSAPSAVTPAQLKNLQPQNEPAALVEALAKLREQPDPKAFEAVLKLSDSNDPMVLRGVFMALGSMGPQLSSAQQAEGVKALMSVYSRFKADASVIAEGHRYTIVQALSGLSDVSSIQSIVDIMKERPSDYALLYLGVESLGKLRAKGALPFLQLESRRLQSLSPPSDKMDQASLNDLQNLLKKTLKDLATD